MVNWQDPGIQEVCAFILDEVSVIFLGIYIGYFISTLPTAEGRLIAGETKLKVAHIPYFVARYGHLSSLVLITVQTRMDASLFSCGSLGFIRISSAASNMALAAASANLGIRALMIWKDTLRVVIPTCIASFCQFVYAVFVGVTGVKKGYDPERDICIVVTTEAKTGILALYILTLCFDATILSLTVVGLRTQGLGRQSRLTSLLFTQGVQYAFISCMTCIPISIFAKLDLNPPMNAIFLVSGSTISVIASCTSVSALLDMKEREMQGPFNDAQAPESSSKVKHAPVSNFFTSYFEPPSFASGETTNFTAETGSA